MKYLVLFAVLLVVWMLWRNSERRAERSRPPPPAAPPAPAAAGKPAAPQDMVRCPVCAVHLPQSDALAGPLGQVYCSAEHARAAGR